MTSEGRTRIAIVEDHALLAESVGFVLRTQGFDVTLPALSDPDQLLADLEPDATLLVLLDLDLGGDVGDGVGLVPPLCASGAAVLIVTGSNDMIRIAAAVEAGALGWVGKDQPFDVLLEVAVRAANGQRVLDEGDRHELLNTLRRHRSEQQKVRAPFDALTPRERAVLSELTTGKSVEAIAQEWVVSEATVRTQVRGVLTKLDVRSQLAAVAKARAAGWSDDG